jgi:hypothetical protein
VDDKLGVLSLNGYPLAGTTAPPASAIPLTVGASPWQYTAPARGALALAGGTVSIIAVNRGAFSMNTGVTSGMVQVSAGDLVIVSYSVVPSSVYFLPA